MYPDKPTCEWDEIARRHGTDKSSIGHDYMPAYQDRIRTWDVDRVLEIGVAGGASLTMWREIFPDASLIIGVDIVPECEQFSDPSNGIFVHSGNATDPHFLHHIVATHGPFDLIIDDGSHNIQDVITTYNMLAPDPWALANGGTYVIEDLHASDPDTASFIASLGTERVEVVPSGEKPDILDPCLIFLYA